MENFEAGDKQPPTTRRTRIGVCISVQEVPLAKRLCSPAEKSAVEFSKAKQRQTLKLEINPAQVRVFDKRRSAFQYAGPQVFENGLFLRQRIRPVGLLPIKPLDTAIRRMPLNVYQEQAATHVPLYTLHSDIVDNRIGQSVSGAEDVIGDRIINFLDTARLSQFLLHRESER